MLTILLSEFASNHFGPEVRRIMAGRPYRIVTPPMLTGRSSQSDVDIAFISRDVTGPSTKTVLAPSLTEFYVPLRQSNSLAWVQAHSAGADRPIFPELMEKGVRVTTSSGANAGIVVQSTVAALLSLARRFPRLAAAQRRHEWDPLHADPPPDIAGQTAVVVGYGPIGQRLGTVLAALDMNVIVVRRDAASPNPADASASNAADKRHETISFAQLDAALPKCDWLILACPLTPLTRHLIDRRRLALLPPGAHLLNVARGEVVVEGDVITALQDQTLTGAYLDVFDREPLSADSPLWDLPNVILSPHSAGHANNNFEAVGRVWLENLRRWCAGEALLNEARR